VTSPTLRTLARLLAPWRTIRRLEDELNAANVLLAVYWKNAGRAEAARLRLQNCPTHGQQPDNAWGCPECVRELRQEDERLRSAMATAREAVRRLVRWNLQGYDSQVVEGIYLWATLDGMAGPLPPLPERLAQREQLQGDQEARC
jgi:hypothetical protein